MSIQLRTILVLNLFVAGQAAVMGYVARETAGRVVEERLSSQMAVGVSGFLQNQSFPISDTMMAYLRDIFHTDWIAINTQDRRVIASSLAAALTTEVRESLPETRGACKTMLGGKAYHMFSQTVLRKAESASGPSAILLVMLVPDAQLQAARQEALLSIFKVFLPALGLSTVVALVLAITITRPIRRLAQEMDGLAQKADLSEGIPVSPQGRESNAQIPPAGKNEIHRLTRSFRHLLDRLGDARRNLALQERLAALGKVSLSVAHEIRNPLSGIKMNVRVLKDELGGRSGETLDVILSEIDRMDLYLHELMGLMAGTGSAEEARAQVRISALCEGVLALLAGRCRHARIEVQRDYRSDEPEVWAQPDAVRQCIMNLLVNAIEAMPEGGILRIGVQTCIHGARLTVADTGKGVQRAAGVDVFEPFVSGKANGVGLGLYLTRQAIERNGGKIGYESGPRGASFWFELPSVAPSDSNSHVTNTTELHRREDAHE